MSITYRKIAPSESSQAMDVWAECFLEDSREFIEYYFKERSSSENILAAFSGDKMVAALHILEKRAFFMDKEQKIGFIAGVGTIPQMRKQGIALKLMETALDDMRTNGYFASLLEPFSFDFYAHVGYEVFVNKLHFWHIGDECSPKAMLCEPIPLKMLEMYEAFMVGHDGACIRSEHDFDLMLKEADITGGLVYMSPDAYAFGEKHDNVVVLYELAGNDVMALVNIIALKNSLQVEYTLPQGHPLATKQVGILKPFNMIYKFRPYDTSVNNYSFERY